MTLCCFVSLLKWHQDMVKEDKELIDKNVIENSVNENNNVSWFVTGCTLSTCQVTGIDNDC